MARFVRISCLLWVSIFVDYALFVMQDYLTTVWNLEVTHAAGILNFFSGLSAVLPLPFLCLARKFLGNFTTLVISTFAYVVGILFIAMSTPPAFGEVSHTCETYQESCIGLVQKALFCAGMFLIAIGVAAQSVSLNAVLNEQGFRQGDCWQILGYIVVVIVAIAGAIGLPYVKPWFLRFGIPTGITFLAAVLFLTGCCSYNKPGPQGNSATAGEEARIARKMFFIWLTVIICGIVSSTGNTYFVEQASNMNRHLGAWKLPLQIFLLINTLAKKFASSLLEKILPPRPRVGVAAAIILSILCCITAAKIETMKLNVITKHGLADKPNDTVPMSVFWLVPQFILLGWLDTLLEMSMSAFDERRIQEDTTTKYREPSYLEMTTNFVKGLGFFGAILPVYVLDTVTEKMGSKTSWFQPTLNKSRLDYYYWALAILSTGNFFAFVLVARTCSKPETNRSEEAVVELSTAVGLNTV